MYHRSWRMTDKLTYIYYVVKDGHPVRIPAYKMLMDGNGLPHYTLDLECGTFWRDFTAFDIFCKHLARQHVNEAYLNDHAYMRLQNECQIRAARINRWLKNRRIARLRAEGKLR